MNIKKYIMRVASSIANGQKKQLKLAFNALAAILLLAGLLQQGQAQTYTLGPAWSAPNGTAHIGNNSGLNRGITYDSISIQVFVATRNGASSAIDVFNGTSGTLLSGAGGIAGATSLAIDQIGEGDDGVLYGSPLTTSVSTTAGSVTVYAWTNWLNNSSPRTAYASASGDPVVANFPAKRIGDTMAVTGSGVNTLILMTVGGGCTNFVLLHTSDGINFTPTVVFVPTGLPSTAGNLLGITFYTNNTFLVMPGANASSHNVFLVSYPANFASQSTVAGTVLGNAATGPLAFNLTAAINYSPVGKMLAVAQTANLTTANTNAIFNMASFPATATQLATTNFATPNANGNATGGAALGGAGKTNFLYVLESNNGLQAYAINFTAAPVAPTISAAPVGASGAFPTYGWSVTANGTAPLKYQWLASNAGTNISSTFTNIPGATTNSFAITTSLTNYYEVIITNSVGAVTSAPVLVSLLKPTTSTVVTQLWSIAPGATGYSYLTTGDDNRGVAYDTNSQRVVVASRSPGLYILDGNTGTNIGTLNVSGVSGGTFALDQVGIADDGAVYAGNLVLAGGAGFTLYSWGAPTNNAPNAVAFQDTSGILGTADRWGDTMAVRGSGLNTQIILGSRAGTNIALLTTTDGINFSGQVIAITNAPSGFAGLGIDFGPGNTIYAKNNLAHLYQIGFDSVNNVGGVLLDYPNPAKTPTYMTVIGADNANNILAGIDLADNPHDLKLFQLTGTSDAPVLFNQAFFPTHNVNGNSVGAIAIKFPKLFALDCNNGLIALTYGTPPTTPPAVITPPASQSSYTNNSTLTLNVSVSGSVPLYYQWQFSTASNGPFANLSGATASQYTLNYPQPAAAGYYRVIVHNVGGYATSAPPALLTVLLPTTSIVVTQLWTIAGDGSLSFLDASSYQTRGLAFDTNTLQLVVADHNNLHVLNATNGAYLGDLTAAGVPTTGYNSWLFDQVGISDDGYLFAGNLAGVGGSGTFSITTWVPPLTVGEGPTIQSYANSDPGNGSGDRWGDTMSVRGKVSDASAQILIGSWNGTNVVLFTSDTSGNLTPNLIAVSGVPLGFSGQGISFGAGNTFWTKSPNYDLRQVSFNTNTTPWTGSVVHDFFNGSQVPAAFGGIGVDANANILGGVNFSDTPNDFQLLLLSDNSNPPALVNQAFFSTGNLNVQENSVATLKAGYGFALDVNNGITAIGYGTPNAPAVTLTSVAYAPGNVTINWNNNFSGHGYQVQYKNALLDVSWTSLGSPVTNSAANSSYIDTTAAGATRFYRVISQ